MIFSAFERMVAVRYLRAKRQEGFISVITWFSLLGIMLGVATLIIVMAVMNGFRQELLDRILGLSGHVNVYSSQGPMTDFDPVAEKLRGLSGVLSVTPIIEAQALVTQNGMASGVMVRGVRVDDLKKRETVTKKLRGSLDEMGNDGIAIGVRMAERLGLGIGDTVTLISPRSTPGPFGSQPRMASYPIAAIFEIGMHEYDTSFIFMPLNTAQTFFRIQDGVTGLEVMVQNPREPNAPGGVRDQVAQSLPAGLRVQSWQDANASFVSALAVERNVMFLILSLIILVAAFNIISSMIMLVKDKGHDIAILRTMGATRGMIMRIFFLSGSSIGLIGTLLGLGLGISFAENIESVRQFLQTAMGWNLFPAEIYFLSQMPAVIDYNEVLHVALMALGLSFGATLYPSWRAARLDPIEALRYE